MHEPRDDPREQSERPRPKVVDKRISARPAEAATGEATAEVTVGSVPETPPRPEPGPEPAPSPGPTPPQSAGSQRSGETESAPRPPGDRVWTPEEEAEARRMAEEIARTPSIDWVVNTAATLANVAGTKLDLGAGGDAQLAIDALAGIVNSVGPRLGAAERPLRQLLADLQLAYAERAAGPRPAQQ